MDPGWIGALAGVAAAAVAAAGLVISVRTSSRQAKQERLQADRDARRTRELTALQERLVKVEEARHADELAFRQQADIHVTVELVEFPSSGRACRFTLVNRGGATAFNVEAHVGQVADPAAEMPPVFNKPIWPLVELRPGHDYAFSYWPVYQPPFLVDVSWSDPSSGTERVARRMQVGL